jgi:hypothetical protein
VWLADLFDDLFGERLGAKERFEQQRLQAVCIETVIVLEVALVEWLSAKFAVEIAVFVEVSVTVWFAPKFTVEFAFQVEFAQSQRGTQDVVEASAAVVVRQSEQQSGLALGDQDND